MTLERLGMNKEDHKKSESMIILKCEMCGTKRRFSSLQEAEDRDWWWERLREKIVDVLCRHCNLEVHEEDSTWVTGPQGSYN